MSIKQKDIKILWGRAASRCSLCRVEVAYDQVHQTSTIPLGEQAHIVAEEQDGPRGASALTVSERNSYANLMLLCPTCHTKIDKAIADFPIERLHHIKTNHEEWVRDSLSGADASRDSSTLLYSHRNVSIRMRQRLRKFYEGNAFTAAARVSRRGVLAAA